MISVDNVFVHLLENAKKTQENKLLLKNSFLKSYDILHGPCNV